MGLGEAESAPTAPVVHVVESAPTTLVEGLAARLSAVSTVPRGPGARLLEDVRRPGPSPSAVVGG